MTLQDSTLGIGKKIRFGLNQINKLSLNNNENGISSSILIEVGFKTYSFGSNLDTAEAQYLLGLIQQKVPQIPHSE